MIPCCWQCCDECPIVQEVMMYTGWYTTWIMQIQIRIWIWICTSRVSTVQYCSKVPMFDTEWSDATTALGKLRERISCHILTHWIHIILYSDTSKCTREVQNMSTVQDPRGDKWHFLTLQIFELIYVEEPYKVEPWYKDHLWAAAKVVFIVRWSLYWGGRACGLGWHLIEWL